MRRSAKLLLIGLMFACSACSDTKSARQVSQISAPASSARLEKGAVDAPEASPAPGDRELSERVVPVPQRGHQGQQGRQGAEIPLDSAGAAKPSCARSFRTPR